ncbi:MAG: hypothetical protein AAFR45_05250 [Pseudomonadota bacterium]
MKRHSLGAAVFASILALMPAASQAEVPITYTDDARPVFTVTVPDFWTVRTGGVRDLTAPGDAEPRTVSRVLGVRPSDDSVGVWVGLIAPFDVRNIDEGVAYLQDVGPFLVESAKVSEQVNRRIGGYPARTFAGTGRRDGRSVAFTAALIDLPGPRVVAAIVIMEPGLDPLVVDAVNDMLGSIRAGR